MCQFSLLKEEPKEWELLHSIHSCFIVPSPSSLRNGVLFLDFLRVCEKDTIEEFYFNTQGGRRFFWLSE